VAMKEFGGNFEKAKRWLYPKYIPNQLSRSRFNRRLVLVQWKMDAR
jgi:hypothetical protein